MKTNIYSAVLFFTVFLLGMGNFSSCSKAKYTHKYLYVGPDFEEQVYVKEDKDPDLTAFSQEMPLKYYIIIYKSDTIFSGTNLTKYIEDRYQEVSSRRSARGKYINMFFISIILFTWVLWMYYKHITEGQKESKMTREERDRFGDLDI